MDKEELQARLDALAGEGGDWLDDVALPHGLWTRGEPDIAHTRLKRIVQTIADLVGKPLDRCRILDLGSLEGLFAIELAQQGAAVVGLEVRQASIARAIFLKEVLGLDNLSFVRADVRELSREHGTFDAIVCSGLLYHLDEDAAIALVSLMYDMAERLVVIDTHVSLSGETTIARDGHDYHGRIFVEHDEADDGPTRLARRLASADNETSFWFTRPSLVNLLSRAGFSSVHECLAPPHLNFGRPGLESGDRCTFVAVKAPAVTLVNSPAANGLVESWPEGTLSYASPINDRSLRARIGRRLRRLLRAA